ncbi:MAG: four helix bundle protein [Alphaproteobacteria bacterium]|nr:four helix bundle protein [Alphaproteobacteria bacterium]
MTKATKLVAEAWDLEVFKRAYAISLLIHKRSKDFPKDELFGLTNQIRRCSKSICANAAEGFAKQEFSAAEFKRFLTIALGSATEIRIWIRYCLDLGYIEKAEAKAWSTEYQTITRMLRGLYGK